MRPLKVQIDNERAPVVADRALELVCRTFGSRPAALISWWRGHTRLLPAGTPQAQPVPPSAHQHQPSSLEEQAAGLVQIHETVSADTNVTSSTLLFVPQIEDDGQLISCKAENVNMAQAASNAPDSDKQLAPSQTGAIEDSLKLDIHYLPRVQLKLGDNLHESQIKEGQAVYFDCWARAQPAAHEIRWWFEGREIDMNRTAGIIISNQSLALAHVTHNQRGRYTCSAANSVGEAHSKPLMLRVQYAPVCRDLPISNNLAIPEDTLRARRSPYSERAKLVYGAARMEKVEVFCHVDADPADNSLQFRWAFANTWSPGDSSKEKQVQLEAALHRSLAPTDALTSVATYTPRSELDYGWLLCWASNSIGQQAEPCAYQLVPAERPDPVRNCRLVNATESQLGVACDPGYDGGVDQSFHMEVYATGRDHELVANITERARALPVPTGWLDPPSGADDLGDAAVPFAGPGEQPRAASSVAPEAKHAGEPVIALRQQKQQRHSSSGAGQVSAQLATGEQLAAFLITEPNLKPSTDYLLSIYSSNSKGASKPVAFTASTSAAASQDPLAASRDARKSGKCVCSAKREHVYERNKSTLL